MFEVIFLGTSASAPSIHRGLSAQVVKHNEHRFLIDARSACTVAAIALDSTERRLRWAVTPGADRYEVFAYDPGDGWSIVED